MGDVTPQQSPPAPPAARVTLSLRANLLLLVVGVLLPVVAFSAFVVRRLAVQQRAVADRRLIQSARDFADSLDRETAGTIRSLAALAQSERLERGDLAAFHGEATRVLAAQPSWWSVILLDPDGHQLLNTLRPFGSPLSSTADPESLRRTVRTGQPTVGSLAAGPSGHILAFPVRVPVVYNGKLRYVLTAVIRPSDLATAVGVTGDRPDEWVRSIVDTHGTVVARSRDPDKFIGKPGSAAYLDSVRDARDGLRRTSTMDGQDVYAAFSHARLSGWVAGVGVPVDAVDGPVTHSTLAVATAGGAMLVLSALGAFALSRRLSREIAAAAVDAESLARGQRLPPLAAGRSSVAELVRLNDSLRRSAELLADRERERDANLARADAARADAEAANHAKDEFLAMLGHELRNPLAPIRTGVHLLATLPPDDDRTHALIQTIERQTEHMTHLVDDLLDASRVARGKVELDRRPLDLRSVVSDVVADLRHQFDQANVSLAADVPDSPVPVLGDPTRLAQCLGNLLHNALKFTPPAGHVRVALTADVAHATLSVHDTGAGIAPDLLPQLFQPFAQGPQSPARTHGGLGLGLALVRGFASLHHGTVSAHSDGPGKGSAFTLTLPLHAGAERSAAPDSLLPPTPQPALRTPQPKRRILIVEDLPDAARTLKLLLSLDGHDVRTAATAADALAAAPDFAPDVVVCDIGLPDMDGYELCRRLRQLPATQSARLIALTGYGQADDVARATAAGFDLHLTKPVDVPTLRNAVSAQGSTNVTTPAVAPAHAPASFGSTGTRS